jgi:hypothetical protein
MQMVNRPPWTCTAIHHPELLFFWVCSCRHLTGCTKIEQRDQSLPNGPQSDESGDQQGGEGEGAESAASAQSAAADASHILIDSTGLKVFGAGEWLAEKHGQKSRRSWRKLHLAVDATTISELDLSIVAINHNGGFCAWSCF